jgi:protein phosphatase
MAELARFHWSSASLTHVGKVRECNEDAYLDAPERELWVVADGMGGHAVGDVASALVVDTLKDLPSPTSLEAYIDTVRDSLQSVNQRLRCEAAKRQESIIGSTVVVLLAYENRCAWLWAGDSRIYLLRDSRLKQLTRDHSQVEQLIAQGLIERSQAGKYSGGSAITRAVGASDKLILDSEMLEVRDSDVFLLCSDGLTNEVDDNEIASELIRGNFQKSCEKLVARALDYGARDNVTAVVIHAEDILHSSKTIINPRITGFNQPTKK